MKTTKIRVPATNDAPEATVHVDGQGNVTLDGAPIGTVRSGHYSYSPRAAGHGGRIARFHAQVGEWQATAPDGEEYRGGIFQPYQRKNTRRGALAFLVAKAAGARDARYFRWVA